jgi:SAM-dependent methyltransferase
MTIRFPLPVSLSCRPARHRLARVCGVLVLTVASAAAQQSSTPFEPVVGQAGKDVVWVPTPPELVEAMLDLAEVTAEDFVIDLGSGDGRNVIAAAQRGARGLGVEYNPDMVALSRRLADEAGVAGRARFERGDMFEADISRASVLALFLLPSNMYRLRDTFVALKPGTRIVANTYGVQDWDPDETVTLEDCQQWCTALLWIVPARVEGTWRVGDGELLLEQAFQVVTGALDGQPVADGRLRGDEISFTAGDSSYTGRVNGNTIEGTVTTRGAESRWRARRN